ncbi:MAG TPA: malto-oligosyltrehalose trehalohydrolase [bacterium]|nr:malto-oligosyltrehalose trehalohydrolase [bacterium]
MKRGYPSLGALPYQGAVSFRLWAPVARHVDVVVESGEGGHPMSAAGQGFFEAVVPGIAPGARYRYRVDNGPSYPDPASRFQPDGVHGPSMVIDPARYVWHDGGWRGRAQEDLVFYELHVGTFTPEGTFAGVRSRLPYLKDLGVTAVELMPVAEFPGRWNWGYDGAALFAPSRAYGSPDDLRSLIDEAHRLELAVFLDVVYNHFGPDGAYAVALSPYFFSKSHTTPWGPGINLDGEMADAVRGFFIENALYWLTEYHFDGLRLDAIHSLADDSPVHFLQELADAVHALDGPPRYVIAEDHRNLNTVILPRQDGGYGLDAAWNDDYHHQLRRLLAHDTDGYFLDFTDSTADLAAIVQRGWLYTGQHARYFGARRGTDPSGIPLIRFVDFIQNHDQVGNRPTGERITGTISLEAFRAASALLLFAPQLPLLFMGQEWAAGTPFCFFTDHHPDLGRRVSEGRRREFQRFAGFRGEVPDPQDPSTFSRSRLDWSELESDPHAGIFRLYQDLLRQRREWKGALVVTHPAEGSLILRRGRHALIVALRADLTLPMPRGGVPILHTEAPRYASDPHPPQILAGTIFMRRPAAVLVTVPDA